MCIMECIQVCCTFQTLIISPKGQKIILPISDIYPLKPFCKEISKLLVVIKKFDTGK